jgi:hypothetical protein
MLLRRSARTISRLPSRAQGYGGKGNEIERNLAFSLTFVVPFIAKSEAQSSVCSL